MPDNSAIAGASTWIISFVQGDAATATAIVAVASLGFSCLWGRLSLRRGALVVSGLFLTLGAATIAPLILLLLSSARATSGYVAPTELASQIDEQTALIRTPQRRIDSDPYAGLQTPTDSPQNMGPK